MSAGRSALVFGDIQTGSHSAEAVLGVVRWLLRFFNDSQRDIKRDFITTVPNEHYNREEAHRAQVFREIRTVPHYTCRTWDINTRTYTRTQAFTGFTLRVELKVAFGQFGEIR